MTVDDLIGLLKEYREEVGGDREVRLMTQESWPFENEILGVTTGTEINAEADFMEDENCVENDDVVYIVEGNQICYGTKMAWRVVRS